MKRILFLIAIGLVLSFSSCKREYECICTSTELNKEVVSTSIIKARKKRAKSACDSETELEFGDVVTVCEIQGGEE